MKLLHLISSMDPRSGGPCQGIRNLTPHTMARGNSIEVVCLDDPNSEYLSNEWLNIRALGQGRGPWSYHGALRPWLSENLSRFDAVFLHGLWQYPGYSLAMAARKQSTPPYFVFPHGMLDPWFQRAPERRLKAVRNWIYWKVIEQHVIRQADAVFFTCAEEMRLARETLRPYHPKHQVNVGYGIGTPPQYQSSMEAAFRVKVPTLKQKPYLLFLGRIHPKKGVDILIEAYAALKDLHIKHGLAPLPRLVIAGPGLETSFGQEMQELALNTCSPGSVFWPGMLAGQAKWGALYGAQAFVLPSHQENFGIAIVEAMACGVPVLISKQINIWREIVEDRAGLVDEDSFEGTRHLLQRWAFLSEQEHDAMKQAAKASYETRFGIARVAHNLLATIQDLIHRSRVTQASSGNGIDSTR